MADYIDREELLKFLIDVPSDINEELTCTTDVLSGCAFRNSEILSFINDMPSIDAVEVVRCKDCIHRNCVYFCKIHDMKVIEYFYCASGVKKNEYTFVFRNKT